MSEIRAIQELIKVVEEIEGMTTFFTRQATTELERLQEDLEREKSNNGLLRTQIASLWEKLSERKAELSSVVAERDAMRELIITALNTASGYGVFLNRIMTEDVISKFHDVLNGINSAEKQVDTRTWTCPLNHRELIDKGFDVCPECNEDTAYELDDEVTL